MQQRSADRDFAAYNEAQDGRAVRPLAVRAAQLVLEEPGPRPVPFSHGSGMVT